MKTPHKRIGEILGKDQVKRDRLRQAYEERYSLEVIIPKVRQNERLNARLNLGRRATVEIVFRVLDEEIRRAEIPFKPPPEEINPPEWELPWYHEGPALSYPDLLPRSK